MRKRTLVIALCAPMVVLTGLLIFLCSPFSAPVINYLAEQLVPDLSIDGVEGSVLSDFSLSGVSWQNNEWRVVVDNATINLGLRCLMSPAFCVQQLSASGVEVVQLSPSPSEDSDDSSTGSLDLPVPVRVRSLQIEDLTVLLPEIQIQLGKLTTGGAVRRSIQLSSTELDRLSLTVPAPQDSAAPSKPVNYALAYQAPELPTIQLPFDVQVEGLRINQFDFIQGETRQQVKAMGFSQLSFSGSQLDTQGLFVRHELGELDAGLTVEFARDYPLQLDSQAQLNIPEQGEQSVTLKASGSLADLVVELNASGVYAGQLTGSANLLSDSLPLDLTVEWPQQALPQVEEGQLQAGTLSLNGTLGEYRLLGQGGVTLPDTGPVPATLDVTLNPNNVTVNDATVRLLDGSISNTGTLYLDETVSWSGQTRFNGVNSTSKLANGPTDMNGQFTSLMRLADAGPEMSITGLKLTGVQSGFPLSVDGSVVYSAPHDLIVATLALQQEKNTLQLVGQIFNQRYLVASLNVDLQQLNTLYPSVSGSISGKIDAQGPWQNPGAKGALNLTDLQVLPELNESLAAQGLLNGKLGIEGTYESHHLTLQAAVPDHQMEFELDGSWQHNQWVAAMQSSELQLLNTRWHLQAPFELTVKPDPLSIQVSEHCWDSRGKGELCIQDVLYADNKTQWQIDARALPLGLWLHELQPVLLTQAPDTTLNLTSQGQFGPQTPLNVQFQSQVTATTWKLGAEQNVVVTTDAIATEGHYQEGVLQASSRVHSNELGEFSARLTAYPEQPDVPLEGTLTFADIHLQPLQPVSKAIRKLTGAFNGSLALSGTSVTPLLHGDLTLDNGAIDIKNMPVTLANWQQFVRFNGQKASFDGSFLLGGGQGSLVGDINWESGLLANLALKGERFEIRQPQVRMQISPDLKARIEPGAVNVEGTVSVPWVRAEIEQLPQNAVSPSKDVHLRGEPPTEDPLSIVNANITLNIDKQKTGEVKLDAFGLTSNLNGSLKLSTHPALVGYGSLQILDGRYQAYGQDLIIQTGEIQFNGPIDQPFLLVEAVRDPKKTDDDVTAGVRIDGVADSPGVNLFCQPDMDQSACLSYLLYGRGPNTSTGDTNYSALLLGFGLSRTDSLTSQVGSALGIEDLSVGTTSGASGEAYVSVTGRINDRLSMEYNFDTGIGGTDSADSVIRRRQQPPDIALRYDLLTRLFLEAAQTTIEEQTEFALDLYYEFFLGVNEAPEEEDDE